MMDIESVKARLDPITVVARYTQQELKPHHNIRCPNREHKQSGKTPPCSMDYHTGLWKCWGCHAQGDLLDFIGYCLFDDYNTDTRPHFKRLLDMIAGLGVMPKPRTWHPDQPQIKLNFDAQYGDKLMEWHYNLVDHARLLDYLDARGVGQDMVASFRLGYIPGDDTRVYEGYRDRLIIPHFYRGVLVGMKYRSMPWQDKVYKHMHGSSASMFFNADALNRQHDVIVWQESELDTVAVAGIYGGGIAALACPAHNMNEEKIEQLEFARHVIYLHDNDLAGQTAAAKVKERVPRAMLLSVPRGKDLGEYLAGDGSVSWLTAELRKLRQSSGKS